MASPALLDFEALLAPIPGETPAGVPVSFEIRDQLEKARKEDDPADYAPDDPRRPDKIIKADWPGIIRLTSKVLTQTSKDLLLAARLTEALVKQNGFPGLRDGLRLLRCLVEECWDRIYPELEDPPDLEVRITPFTWLDDPDRGAHFPSSIQSVPLVTSENGAFGWVQWWQSQKQPELHVSFEKAVLTSSWENCQASLDELTEAQNELDRLAQVLATRMGPVAPGLLHLKEAVGGCRTLAQQILERKGPPPSESAGASTSTGEAVAPVPAVPARSPTTRDDVYRQLTQAAAVLQRLEPHSPIPYLIQRAVALGALPFPEMIKALIREPNVLAELNRELGIPEEAPPAST